MKNVTVKKSRTGQLLITFTLAELEQYTDNIKTLYQLKHMVNQLKDKALR